MINYRQILIAGDADDIIYMIRKLMETTNKHRQNPTHMVIRKTGRKLGMSGKMINNITEYKYLGVTQREDEKDEDILHKEARGDKSY